MSSIVINYGDQKLVEADEPVRLFLKTGEKSCEFDIEIDLNSDFVEPTLPSEYQRVEYLDFTPPVGVKVSFPTFSNDTTAIMYEVDFMSRRTDNIFSCALSNRESTSHNNYEFYMGATNNKIVSYNYNTGIQINNNGSYVVGTRTKVYILRGRDFKVNQCVGKYYFNFSQTAEQAANALDGRIYSVRIIDIIQNKIKGWFVPCYRKSDNQVGFYNHNAQAFYSDIDSYGSEYAVMAGPDII